MQMPRKFFVCLTLSLLTLLVSAVAVEAQGYWWKNERFLKELALTPDQSSRIEALYQAAQPALRAQKRALDMLEDELQKMIHDVRVSDAELEQFVVRVESAKADLSKTRALMLVKMSRVLSADQSKKLHQLFDQVEKQGRGRPHGPTRKQK
jgi:Spy/CpxP family protein refolding chaperone